MLTVTNLLAAVALAGSMLGASGSPLPVDVPVPLIAETEFRAQTEERRPIDVNSATADDLQKIPGIGEALARRIIEFREEHGPFEKIDDLLNVRGIGTTSLEKLRPYLAVKKQG